MASYRAPLPLEFINSFMARNRDVMTRQVSRQLQRYRWKAMFKARDRRGKRCPYESVSA